MKKSQEIFYKFSDNDDYCVFKCIAKMNNSENDKIIFYGREIALHNLTAEQRAELVKDLKDYSQFISQLADEVIL